MEAEEVYRYLIENQDFVVFQLDTRGNFTFVSPAVERFSGYTVTELVGQPFAHFVHPEDLELVLANFQNLITSGSGTSEFRAVHKNGSILWLRGSSRFSAEAGGRIVGIFTDITARKQVEAELREANQFNRQIIACVGEGIAVLDRDLRYVLWNPYLEEHTGLPASKMIGKSPWEVFPDLARIGIASLLERTLQGETTPVPDMLSKSPAASEAHWVSGENSPLRDAQGKIIGVIVTARDITWRKRAEEALRASEDRYRDLAENSQDLLCTHDLQGKLLWLNSAPASALGYSVEEMTGAYMPDFVAPEFRERFQDYLKRIQREGSAQGLLALVTRSGEQRIWEYNNTLRTEGVDSPIVRGMARDVTERIRAEQELRRSEERFRVALKTARICVFNQDRELRYTWLYHPMLAWAEQDCIGKTDEEILTAEDAEIRMELNRRVLESGVGIRQELPVTYRGRSYHLNTIIEPLFDSKGKVVGITGARMDVTELRETAEKLRLLSKKLAQEKLYLESEIEAEHKFEEIVGESAPLREALSQARVVAATDSTVLVLGETGTGKELVARAVHRMSVRNNNSFIKLNCSAIPTGLLESELFGHEKGAFTGAVTQKIGRLELADKGSLFLDEVGDIPLELQPKLLRVLQDQEFERLGGTRTIKVNVRLIAATNRDLGKSVAEKQFRSDLFYRLNVFPIRLPALRERRDDIPMLVRHFVHKYAARMNKKIDSVSRESMAALTESEWPGNIRELENFIERSVILTDGPVLSIPLTELEESATAQDRGLEAAERAYIVRVLQECRGRIAGPNGAAVRLGLKRTTLQSKIRQLGITREEYENVLRRWVGP